MTQVSPIYDVAFVVKALMYSLCSPWSDESEEVEHQVQKVIQEMEKILGEPLQSYF